MEKLSNICWISTCIYHPSALGASIQWCTEKSSYVIYIGTHWSRHSTPSLVLIIIIVSNIIIININNGQQVLRQKETEQDGEFICWIQWTETELIHFCRTSAPYGEASISFDLQIKMPPQCSQSSQIPEEKIASNKTEIRIKFLSRPYSHLGTLGSRKVWGRWHWNS